MEYLCYPNIYFEKFFFLERFMRKNLWLNKLNLDNTKEHELALELLKSSGKCIMISNAIFLGHSFSKGKQFYLLYLKTSFKATIFGFFYSVYFNDEKLELFLSKRNMS